MALFGKLGRAFIEKAGSNALRLPFRQDAAAIAPFFIVQSRGMATSKLFIGGLAWGLDEKALSEAFASFGEVTDVRIITDRETGRSRGFGFVSFNTDAEAQAALQQMDGSALGGRTIRVDYATDRTTGGNPGGGFGSGGGGFGSGGGSFGSGGGGSFGNGGGGSFNRGGGY